MAVQLGPSLIAVNIWPQNLPNKIVNFLCSLHAVLKEQQVHRGGREENQFFKSLRRSWSVWLETEESKSILYPVRSRRRTEKHFIFI